MTLGVILAPTLRPLVTLELPWRDNAHDISHIPCGSYPCEVITHAKLGEVIHVQNVPSRDGILIHVGNYPQDTKGCILVGNEIQPAISTSVDTPFISHSREAMQSLLLYVKQNLNGKFTLFVGATSWPSIEERND